MSGHPVVVDLCNLFKKPLISTSANISGKSEIKDPLLFKKTFMTEIKCLVDGRLGNYEKTSIIVDMESEQKIR
jgi:tRNA A37 threonylcarbamoyladenosine synthetase subunit TsaC/SUA5/YrdC